jgi:hypothetical protein
MASRCVVEIANRADVLHLPTSCGDGANLWASEGTIKARIPLSFKVYMALPRKVWSSEMLRQRAGDTGTALQLCRLFVLLCFEPFHRQLLRVSAIGPTNLQGSHEPERRVSRNLLMRKFVSWRLGWSFSYHPKDVAMSFPGNLRPFMSSLFLRLYSVSCTNFEKIDYPSAPCP